MSEPVTPNPFRSVDDTAFRLQVPTSWLKAEAEAGRVPALRIGKRYLMDLGAVRGALVRRSEANADAVETRGGPPDGIR